MTMQPLHFPAGQRRLFGVVHVGAAAPRAMAVLCPPLLHEHTRSHRFLSQFAQRIADDGITCLRFDYFGTGDSDGDDADFSPAAAPTEIACAVLELHRLIGERLPLVLIGVRASALFVVEAAAAAGADALWLWQPVRDGREYVDGLDAVQRIELASRDRYPIRPLPAPSGPDDLMGFAVSPRFRDELSQYRLATSPTSSAPLRVALIDAAGSAPLVGATQHALPDGFCDWADEIDFRSVILPRDVEPVVQALLRDVPDDLPMRAHG